MNKLLTPLNISSAPIDSKPILEVDKKDLA
jgi:hypothetical protein